jgi:hypothetical protein
VEVVEHHQPAQRQPGVHRAADGRGDGGADAEGRERGDRGPVVDLMREPLVSGAVPGEVGDLDARPPSQRDRGGAVAGDDPLLPRVREAGQRVPPVPVMTPVTG